MSTLCIASIKRCRNRFVGARLYQLSGARSRAEFASWCDYVDHPHHYLVPDGAGVAVVHQPNPKWLRLLDDGIQLHTGCLKRLCAAFPDISAIISHPLWEILSWDSDDRAAPANYLENLRPHCRALAGSTYRSRINARMKWALGVPDWTHLAMPLVLLRCAARDHAPQRRWLVQHFPQYLTLASLSPACHRCFADLWTIIDQWLRAGGLGTDLLVHWPANADAFEYLQAKQQVGREELMDCGWLPAAHQPSRCDLAMLWCIHMGGPELDEKLMRTVSRGARRCPPLLHQLMRELDPRLDVVSSARRASRPLSVAPAQPVGERG
ncbi:hypothetical protein [Pseudomonas kilonensis]|uniref:hypothetical protein n=1 Tax=Pseudomonas kilonensis TaxID=132476 RepID=UPI001183E3A9|nr:hypothetical protein [Pseudomonas kilonensis]